MKSVRIHQFGGPEVLQYEDVPLPSPKPGQAAVKIEASGVNFIDIYHRTGLYQNPFPLTLGQEGAGVVTAVGEGVTSVKVGDRVAWAGGFGNYAEQNIVAADRLVELPPGVSTRQGAAAMLQGMTAHYLACTTFPLKAGHTCLIHAGAGGAGLLLTQIAKLRGARIFTTVSTDEKAELSREAGADEVIVYSRLDFEAEVKRLTDGRGVEVVYDSVGRATFEKSLNCLAARGTMVLFGQSSGPAPPFDPQRLQKGSLFLTRPTLFNYIARRDELEQRARDVFAWMASGELLLRTELEFPLKDAAEAHRALEGRKSTGKILLIP
jgi:NADPH2:quinone reductase